MEEKTELVPKKTGMLIVSAIVRILGTTVLMIGVSSFLLLVCALDTSGDAFCVIFQLLIASMVVTAVGVLIRHVGKANTRR